MFELAEVVRNLAIRESEKGLSTGEKQMYTRAKKILASELMYALEMEEDEAEGHLEDLIAEAHASRNGQRQPPPDRDCVRRRHHCRRRQRRAPWSRRPKAFVALAGRPMLEWSVAALSEACDEVVVAAPPGHDIPGRSVEAATRARRRFATPCSRRRRPRSTWCTTPRGRW